MPNLALTLKAEISRLARKEIKAHLKPARRAAVRHRKEIATLKRQLKAAERKIAALGRSTKRPADEPADVDELEGTRFSIRSVRAQRRRLKLSAAEFGRLLNVTAQTIYNWEHGKARPARNQFAALVEARSLGRREVVRRLAK